MFHEVETTNLRIKSHTYSFATSVWSQTQICNWMSLCQLDLRWFEYEKASAVPILYMVPSSPSQAKMKGIFCGCQDDMPRILWPYDLDWWSIRRYFINLHQGIPQAKVPSSTQVVPKVEAKRIQSHQYSQARPITQSRTSKGILSFHCRIQE